MRTQLFNQRAFAFLMPGVTLAMNALSLVIYWVGASIVNAVPAADTAARLAAFSDIVVFGTYATYVIMSIMMMVMIITVSYTHLDVYKRQGLNRLGQAVIHLAGGLVQPPRDLLCQWEHSPLDAVGGAGEQVNLACEAVLRHHLLFQLGQAV